jgi:hypothetical protein
LRLHQNDAAECIRQNVLIAMRGCHEHLRVECTTMTSG